MKFKQLFIFMLLFMSITLNFLSPTLSSALVFLSASGLFCVSEWLDSYKANALDSLKSEIKQLNERVDQLSIRRGFNQ